MNTPSLKKLDFFSKKEKKPDKTKILIKIIDKIEKTNPEKRDKLQDIKIDIEEKIPLTTEKKTFLKNEIGLLKKAKNQKQELKKPTGKIDDDIPDFENAISAGTTSLDILEQIVKKIGDYSEELYQETQQANEEIKLTQIKEKNEELQKNLRHIISNLHITQTEILDKINKAKSTQTKVSILQNELNLKKDFVN